MPAFAEPLPLIRPITDLRTKLNDVCELATESQEPVVLTKNGVSSFVLLDSAAYDAAERRNRIYLALREAEIEEKYRPQALTEDEANERVRKVFAHLGIAYGPDANENAGRA